MIKIKDLEAFQNFNIKDASPSLWVFKKRTVSNQLNPFAAVSVIMSPMLQGNLKELVADYQRTHGHAEAYNLLAQTSEGCFLSVPRENTLFPDLQRLIDQPVEDCLAKQVKQLNNAAGYVFRLKFDGQVLYCVKKTSADWATRKKRGYMNILFKESALDIIEDPSFSIARQFDFFVIGEEVFMTNRPAFESILNHRTSYEECFMELKQDEAFYGTFSDIGPIDAFVGTNATQLRRMAVIRARGYYNNPNYLARLREVNLTRGWGIQFDEEGRIVPTSETMRAIMQILLDHRLRSELSDNQYDVPSTSPVA